MDDLFANPEAETQPEAHQPLAARMRPRNLEEFAGQTHILGEGKLLRRAVEAGRFTSIILYGPPGTGKTTLAQIIASASGGKFRRLSGVESNVAEIRKAIQEAVMIRQSGGGGVVLFIDEIHRFNKAQQDVLLPDVENGTVKFIGATTHNPFFYVNSPLVSRSQIFQLQPLDEDDLLALQKRALRDAERGYGTLKVDAAEEALRHLALLSDGDARKCLGALELAVETTPETEDGTRRITLEIAEESIQRKAVVYDGEGDEHYDTISAFIKSIRGSDPDAALYWLAKMLYAGEEIRFIARRLVIAASEDIGMADSHALQVAIAAQQAVEFVGLPEAQIPLAHATVYLATAPKSNAAYAGLGAAMKDVREGRTLPVPDHLKDSHYAGAKQLGHGKGYQYSHDYPGNYVPQAYLPEGRHYYFPTDNGYEKRVQERLAYWRALFEKQSAPISKPT